MRRDLPLSELADFLALPLVAVLATYRRDGGVLLSPVWHRWRDGGFEVISSPNDIKVRHLRRDPRASILVYDNEPPYRGVEVRTTATLLDVKGADVARDLAARYLGKEAGEAYASESSDSVLIRLEPGSVRTWDFADDF
ncbi:MAG TPA: TIGR03618 family F420-dependent PPOX class oxidoreductase [Gaiellaceae bacterium]|nr:TIGR03618 family F420-dependent PPOX class oxidoreductase [Gaiellaceae bacterium]